MTWRMFGTRHAAETLFQAMSGDDEQNRMLAGMSLVKAGKRSFDFIEEKIAIGEASPPVIRLLPDIDGPRTRAVLSQFAVDASGEMADTARQCIDLLDRIDDSSQKTAD